jgi:hypothetical protein
MAAVTIFWTASGKADEVDAISLTVSAASSPALHRSGSCGSSLRTRANRAIYRHCRLSDPSD